MKISQEIKRQLRKSGKVKKNGDTDLTYSEIMDCLLPRAVQDFVLFHNGKHVFYYKDGSKIVLFPSDSPMIKNYIKARI